MIEQRWHHLPTPSEENIVSLASQLNTSRSLTTILLQRGIDTFEKARSFFTPCLSMLHDPMEMQDMKKAVDRILQALARQEAICVYGDYDVDGVTSIALLYRALKKMGANVIYYLPDRHKEGYGVSILGIEHCIANKINLLITIDCGIKAVAPINKAKEAGIDAIICDHHEPGITLPPALAILNPKQKSCPYPFKELSGCAIGYKLLQGLVLAGCLSEDDILPYLDLVALSIAADIVPMLDENRVLSAFGLKQLNKNPCPGIAALKSLVRRGDTYHISDIVFGIAPRINAAGRVSHARHAVELLLCEDFEEAASKAKKLDEENQYRKDLDLALLEEALASIADDDTHPQRCTTVLFGNDWHKGILGIAAARTIEYHYRPTLILTKQKNEAVGSARSVWGYNIYNALEKCSDLLTRYGGHAYAAGLTMPLSNIEAFKERFENIVQESIKPDLLIPHQVIDTPLRLEQITPAFYNVMNRMRPFGPGHRQPVFTTAPLIIKEYAIYQEKHLALQLQEIGKSKIWRAIGFNMAHLLPKDQKQTIAIAYTIQQSTYQGYTRYELFLKDLKLH